VETLWRVRRDSRRYRRTGEESCSGPFGLKTSELGFTLLDVVVAITVLMVILLPVAYLLSTTGKTQANNQNRLTAQSLAASWLQQEQTVANQSTTGAPAIYPPTGTSSTSWPIPGNPTNAPPPTTETVGSVGFDIYLSGGWCAYAGANMPWTQGSASTTSTSYAAPPLSYVVAVKVKWGPDKGNVNQIGLNDGQVVEYSSAPSQSGWDVSVGTTFATATSESVLTLTTTTGIWDVGQTNYCPLSLS
jgi:type II secretory pathway pseudopilin PulG